MSNFTGWIAYLSNGDTVPEGNPVPGERTPWQKLLQKCRDENIEINRMSLVVNGVQLMSLPQKQCDGFFQAKEVRKHWFESMGEDAKTEEIRLQGIGSVIGDQVYITWVNLTRKEHVIAYITPDVRPLESCKIHTTLQ